jgi:hypothetical protein
MIKFRLSRPFRIFSISLLATITFIAVSSAIVSLFYERAVVRFMKNYLAEHLLTEISMDEIRFRALKGFPNGTIEISNVVILSGVEFEPADFGAGYADTLLKARMVAFQFDLLKLFNKDYELKKIEITRGFANILYDKRNRHNMNIWKSRPDSTVQNYSFNLRAIQLNGIRLNLVTLAEQFRLTAIAEKSTFRGNYRAGVLSGDIRGDFQVDSASIRQNLFMKNASLGLQMKMLYSSHRFRIRNSSIRLNKALFTLRGEYIQRPEKYVDLSIDVPDFGLDELMSLLPVRENTFLSDFTFTGKGKLHATLKGPLARHDQLMISSEFELTGGSAHNKNTRVSLDKINLTGEVSGTRAENFMLRINQFSSTLGKGTLQGNFTIHDFKTLGFNANISSSLDLNVLNDLLDIDTVETMKGFVQADIEAAGHLTGLSGDSIAMAIGFLKKGSFVFHDAGIKLKNRKTEISHVTGRASFDNLLRLDSLAMKLGGNDLLIKGTIENLAGYLMKNGALRSDLDIATGEFNINNYLGIQSGRQGRRGARVSSFFPGGIRLNARVKAGEFIAGKFRASDLRFTMALKRDSILVNEFYLKFPDGSISGNALLFEDNNHRLSVICNSKPQSINIQQLFTSFNNFTQHFILDKNVKGSVTGNVGFFVQWDSTLVFIPASMKANAKIEITNGALVQFEPMMALSKYINVDELRHIEFKTLKNEIFISDRMVTIPEMAIHSSAFNISVSGTHSFENLFDYRLRVLLGEVLFNKARKKRHEINEFFVEETRADQTTIPLIVAGTPDNFDVRFDRKRAFDLTRKNMKNESSAADTKVSPDNFRIEWEEDKKKPPEQPKPVLQNKTDDFEVEWEE